MALKPPPDRRKFAHMWDEISYLHHKLLYWLYQREEPVKARPYAERLKKLLPKASPDHQAILGEECWSLVYETEGDLEKAIRHRHSEIRLMRRLQQEAKNTSQAKVVLANYGLADLSDRLDLLATLYHDRGDLGKAIATLEESKKICADLGLTFDGQDLLEEYALDHRRGQVLPGVARRS